MLAFHFLGKCCVTNFTFPCSISRTAASTSPRFLSWPEKLNPSTFIPVPWTPSSNNSITASPTPVLSTTIFRMLGNRFGRMLQQ